MRDSSSTAVIGERHERLEKIFRISACRLLADFVEGLALECGFRVGDKAFAGVMRLARDLSECTSEQIAGWLKQSEGTFLLWLNGEHLPQLALRPGMLRILAEQLRSKADEIEEGLDEPA